MDRQEEYHDPDYPEAPPGPVDEVPSTSEEETVEKIRRIVRREMANELEARESDVMLIDQRSLLARRLLQRLRYVLVNNYYGEERLKLTAGQMQDEVAAQSEPRARTAVSNVLRDSQRRLHPSVRKLLGKQSSPVELHEILGRSRAPRSKTRKNYSAMIQSRNYTIPAQPGASLRPPPPPAASGSRPPAPAPAPAPAKLPRRIVPKLTNVLTLDEATRNQTKHRYRIIIGNTSKYCPPASSADRSTHKWLLYVRGPPDQPDLSAIVTSVTVRLHHSYAPHHTVHIDKPPFHVSRRGWGEFPARVTLHFTSPTLNRPADVEHTIKLDRNYTGFQTLGAETVVDVWLYSSQEMLQYEFMEPTKIIKEEPIDPEPQPTVEQDQTADQNIFDNNDKTDNWLDFFSNTTELDVDEMIIKPQKKVDEGNVEDTLKTNVLPKEEKMDIDLENIKREPEEEWNGDITVRVNAKINDIPNELLTQQPSPKKRIMKYMDPTTGKIYYLEMDRKLDLTTVQEIIISSKGNVKTAKISPIKPNGLKNIRKTKKGVSLLKPEVKSLLKNETTLQKSILKKKYAHIENDHCYLGPVQYSDTVSNSNVAELSSYFEEDTMVTKEKTLFEDLCSAMLRLCSVKVAVDFCLRKIPLVSSEVKDVEFVKCFPFVVETEDKYWTLDFTKRRNMEWSRAKLINKLLSEYLNTTETIWRTKQILIYSRLHGYYPVRPDIKSTANETEWSSWNDLENCRKESNIRELYPNATDITTLTTFNPESFTQNLSESLDLDESDEEVEIVKWDDRIEVKKEPLADSSSELPVLPVTDPQERLRYMFLERTCADIGIELRNENIGNGYSYSAVHCVLSSAARSFVAELVRAALAARTGGAAADSAWPGSYSRTSLQLEDLFRGAQAGRLAALTARCLGAARTHVHTML